MNNKVCYDIFCSGRIKASFHILGTLPQAFTVNSFWWRIQLGLRMNIVAEAKMVNTRTKRLYLIKNISSYRCFPFAMCTSPIIHLVFLSWGDYNNYTGQIKKLLGGKQSVLWEMWKRWMGSLVQCDKDVVYCKPARIGNATVALLFLQNTVNRTNCVFVLDSLNILKPSRILAIIHWHNLDNSGSFLQWRLF